MTREKFFGDKPEKNKKLDQDHQPPLTERNNFSQAVEYLKEQEDRMWSELPKELLNKLLKNNLARALYFSGVIFSNGCATSMAENFVKQENFLQQENTINTKKPDTWQAIPWLSGETLSKDVGQMDLSEKLCGVKEQLAFYRAMGYEISLNYYNAVMSSRIEDLFLDNKFLFFVILQEEFASRGDRDGVATAADPLSYCRYRNADAQEVPAKLASSKKIEFNPLFFRLESYGNHRFRLSLDNYLNDQEPTVFTQEVVFNENDSKEAKSILTPLIHQALSESESWFNNQFDLNNYLNDAVLDPEAINKQPPTYEVGRRLADNEQSFVNNLLGKFKKIDIDSTKVGGELDRILISEGMPFAQTPSLKITPNNLPNNSILVSGKINDIILTSHEFVVTEKDDAAKTINGEPRSEVKTDKYGNLIAKVIISTYLDKTAFRVIMIYPPLALATAGDLSAQESVELKIDWRLIGDFDEEESKMSFLNQKNFKPQFFMENNTPIYTNFEKKENVESKLQERIAVFYKGAEQLEKKLGYQPQGLVKKLFLTNSLKPNAHFSPVDKDILYVWDELLRADQQLGSDVDFSLEKIGLHEAAHLFDARVKINDSDVFKKLFLEIKTNYPDFFKLINESSFLHAFGGHSADSSSEFLATLVASLDNKNWEVEVKQYGQKFISWYKKSLITLKDSLLSNKLIQQDASVSRQISQSPLIGEVGTKINYLDKLNNL